MRRLKKLLALAGDGAAAPGEAANAMRMAQALMAKYNINETTLASAEIAEEYLPSSKATSPPPWEAKLLAELARAFGARILWNYGVGPKGSRSKGAWTLLAVKPQAELIKYAAEVLRRQLLKARAAYIKTQPDYWTRPRKAADADLFGLSYVTALSGKISTFANPEPVEKALQLRFEQLSNGGKVKMPRVTGTDRAAQLGAEAGAQANLHRPMQGREALKQIGV